MLAHYESGVVIVDTHQIVSAPVRKVHDIPVDQYDRDTSLSDLPANMFVDRICIFDPFQRREKDAVDPFPYVVVRPNLQKVRAYLGIVGCGSVPQALEHSLAGQF